MRNLGIQGFEAILRGGIPGRAEVLLLAPDGPDRHLLGAHWVLEGLAGGERALVLLSSEAPDTFLARLGRMGVDIPAALASGSLVVVDWYTCWTQALEGVEESHRILRASRDPVDLLEAIERGVAVLAPATERRAYVDFLPLALKAFDGVQATDLLGELRAKLSEADITGIFVGDRTLPEARLDGLLQTFHAVLDARAESRDTLALGVLGVGGVKLTARYRGVHVREDGASVEVEAAVRTFSCPICDARVPFSAPRCPGCGTPRSEMAARARPSGLMDYVEALGRKEGVEPERGRVAPRDRQGLTNGRRPAPGRVNGVASGRVNGVAPGRVNGVAPTGRVNGIAPAGRVNGVAPPDRTNGLQGAGGRTNGLVNGIRSARGGITNGITNGSGFTNGLGGHRYRSEVRVSRWKILLVPVVSTLLLMTPFFFLDAPPGARIMIDGNFDDWRGVPGYVQDADPEADPSVAITGHKIVQDGSAVFLYASVTGPWFSGPEPQALYAFVDTDGNATTGYRVRNLGASLLVTVEGSGGTITSTSLRSFPDGSGDPYNWTAWESAGSARAAAAGRELELSFTAEFESEAPGILLMADDGTGSRSYSAVAFGPELGALRVSVQRLNANVSRGTPEVLAVEMEAFGEDVSVVDFAWVVNDGVRRVSPPLPVTVRHESPNPDRVVVQFDTTESQPGDLLDVQLVGVRTDPPRPVLIVEDRVRAYVDMEPTGKRVDGWFDDWVQGEFQSDTDGGRPPADLDVQQFAANRTGSNLYVYADVRGQIFAGTPAPVRRVQQAPGEPQPSAPAVPARIVGEDILRVYVDADANASAGVPLPTLGLAGADYLLEVHGIHGVITTRAAYEWRGSWEPLSAPAAENNATALESSLPIANAGLVQIVYQTSSWRGPEDSTTVTGTRGVRGVSGSYVADGAFTTSFHPGGLVEVSAEGTGLAWRLPSPGGGPWALEPTSVGVRYSAAGMDVRYTVDAARVKEELVLAAPPESGELSFRFSLLGGAMAWTDPDGSIGVLRSGTERVFTLPPPFAVDPQGSITNLAFELDVAAGTLVVPFPASLLQPSAYPLLVDPVVSYTLRNDGPSSDTGENVGWSVAVGDFNGDGYADVLTGAPANDRPPRDSPNGLHGYAYIYYGPFSADDSTPDVWINATPYTNSTRFGYAVAAGRFNGDQYWDALVARRSLLPGGWVGNVSVYYGASGWSGEEATPDVNFVPPGTPKNFGEIVATGNLDNANGDDVLIAEPGRDLNADSQADGVVYVYMAPFSSAETSSDYRLVPSSNGGGQLGLSMAVGKVDSDAYADVLVGEPKYQNGGGDGRLQLYKGSHFTSGSGDVSPDATIGAPSGGGNTGNFGAAVAVGALNGDAYEDVLVGAPFKFTNDGRAYVFSANGDGSGLTTGASPSVTISSVTSAERFGTAVLIADWSDDGVGDAIVGAPQAAAGGTNRGRVYWFDDPLTNQVVDETMSGSQDNEFFGRVLAIGKFASDGRRVLAIGAYLWDKNGSNPNDNDGRVVVAVVPELPESLAALALLVGLAGSLSRRRLRRSEKGGSLPLAG